MLVKTTVKIEDMRRMRNGAWLITYTLKRAETRGGVTTLSVVRGATFAPAWLVPGDLHGVKTWLACSLAGFESVELELGADEETLRAACEVIADLDGLVGRAGWWQTPGDSTPRLRVVGTPATLCTLASALNRAGEEVAEWGDDAAYGLIVLGQQLRDAHKASIRDRWQELGALYRVIGVDCEERHFCESRAMRYIGRPLDTRSNARAWLAVAPEAIKVFGTAPFGRRRAQG